MFTFSRAGQGHSPASSSSSRPQLKILWLSGNRLRTLQFNSNQMPRLEALYLDNNGKGARVPLNFQLPFHAVNISNAPRLEYLDLRNTNASCPTKTGLTCLPRDGG
ncbi:MAG: leucine-rich repeat domain-containing protein [Chloroflexota bacterium]|nr:leucine-rich repeat domain-containing protein [Chloroflexota bacterium]MDE2842166.1 leucine-rich repeat domain-containing protein [Chloroflexota bacterium]